MQSDAVTASGRANAVSVAGGPEATWDPAYEWKIVLLLSLAFGLVGLDRWILPPLFPAMMRDLHLSYADLGNLVGVLALSWGACAILCGNLSDRLGRRKVVIPAIVAFSLLSSLSGLMSSVMGLLVVRGIMGAAEGAFTPTGVAAAGEASLPRRRGLNQGVMMSCFALLGFGLAPIIATQLLSVMPSWRGVFMLVGAPGLVLAILVFRVLRDPPHLRGAQHCEPREPWSAVARSFNVQIATAATLCAMSCVIVTGTMTPNYLVDHLHLSLPAMGFVMSAMGWGGFLGEVVVPGASDLIGRRPASFLAFLIAIISLWVFVRLDANPPLLFLTLFVVAFCSIGLLALLTGPVASEAVSAALTSSAIGLVSGVGEIFGGGIAPLIAGHVAASAGIERVFYVPLVGLSAGLVISAALRETAPRLVVDR